MYSECSIETSVVSKPRSLLGIRLLSIVTLLRCDSNEGNKTVANVLDGNIKPIFIKYLRAVCLWLYKNSDKRNST